MVDTSELSDISSESGVIGTLISHPEFISHTDFLKPGYFYNTENACLYWAIFELYQSGITNIDSYNLSNKLQNNSGVQKTIEKYNLPATQELIDLYKETARDTLEEYKMLAENVTTYAFKRDLIKSLDKVISDCYKSDTSLEKISNTVYKKLDDLTQKYVATTEIHTIGDNIEDIWNEIVSRRNDNGTFGIPSKYNCFNDYFTYEPGELVVVQAKYKEGKSILLMNEVVHKLKNNMAVLVADSEMQSRLYVERLLSHLTGIEAKRIKAGLYSKEEGEIIRDNINWLKGLPFVHIYDPNMTLEKLYSICKMLQNSMQLGFVVYDYMKSTGKSTEENYNILGAKCDFLKNKIAGELNLPVLAACQLNRNGEVADSIKINQCLSVAIKWGYKSHDMIAKDGLKCGNAYAKIYVSRLGEQIQDDEDNYMDFIFDGSTMTIVEAEKHERENLF